MSTTTPDTPDHTLPVAGPMPNSSTAMADAGGATPPTRRRAWTRPVAAAGAGLVLGALLGVGFAQIKLPGSTPFPAALEACGVADSSYFRAGDEGMSLSVQSKGKEDPGADFADVSCVLRELDVPDSVVSRMGSTRALDGRQSGHWKNLEASWTYHPDSGMNLLIEVAQD